MTRATGDEALAISHLTSAVEEAIKRAGEINKARGTEKDHDAEKSVAEMGDVVSRLQMALGPVQAAMSADAGTTAARPAARAPAADQTAKAANADDADGDGARQQSAAAGAAKRDADAGKDKPAAGKHR